MRAAAALHYGDSNIVLTGYLTENSRMMIHRRVRERLRRWLRICDGTAIRIW